ncbi:hypothetical protein NQ176_g4431 [Zarea fungicola]|uniref:Uncharacterized protein n=1 Tax=Zarea fungicola TaxID=93591 RepID=A0ACC1NDD4_9HYPO|nr:hypothetical protein NQ176_g4431 [Lecanicillium fungicola]
MVQYVEVVNNILVSVSTDLAIYRQSCEAVLRRLILPENILDELLHKRSSRAWEDEGLAVQIKKQFGSSSEYNTYLQAVVRLNKRIDKLRSKLELDENFQPMWMDDGSVDRECLAKFFSTSRTFRRAVKIGFNQGKYAKLAEDIESDVDRISKLTRGARTLEPIRAEKRAKEAAKYWLNVRDCARGLFTALSSRWTCPCRITHVASLRLGIEKISLLRVDANSNRKFKILFSFEEEAGSTFVLPWQWRVVEVDAQPAPAPPSTIAVSQTLSSPAVVLTHPNTVPTARIPAQISTSSITNLCDALSRATHQSQPLGFLSDNIWHHHLHNISSLQGLEGGNGFASLEQVLESPESMGTKTKFKIAAVLASAVLQFHSTPWLKNSWDLRDIYFFRDNGSRIMTDQPYISRRFVRRQRQHPSAIHGQLCISNEITFALGVALLELSYGRPLLSFQQCDDLDENGAAYGLTKFSIAKRLVGGLDQREPSKYADVVDRCIRCRFDTTETSLENPIFLTLFCQGVVTPLQEICDSVS